MRKIYASVKQVVSLKPVFVLLTGILLLAVASACGPRPMPSPAPELTSTPVQAVPSPTFSLVRIVDDGAPLPPQVVDRLPQPGEELSLNGFIELIFDQPMEKESTEQAWRLSDMQGSLVPGKVRWVSTRVFQFKPDQSLQAGQTYSAVLSTQAKSSAGVSLTEAYAFTFQTVQPLMVSQVFPASGASEIENQTVITVLFNRPVVPLVSLEEQEGLPNPLEISPEISGRGEWINTSLYVFRPDAYWKSGTRYQVTVKAGLKDALGETELLSSYSWSFKTASSSVDGFWLTDVPWDVNPQGLRTNVRLQQGFAIRFRQPMDRASVEKNLGILSLTGKRAPLEFTWGAEDTLVVFTPTVRLALGAGYWLKLDQSASAKDGGELEQGIEWRFTTAAYPRVTSTDPAHDTVQQYFFEMFRINFASPMRFSTLKDKVIFDPPLTGSPQWYYDECGSYGGNCGMYIFGLQPSTRYTVRILPGMEDLYGNKTLETLEVSFRTAAYMPSAYLQMPQEGPVVYRVGGLQEFFVAHQNIEQIQLKLYRLTAEQFASMQVQYSDFSPWYFRPDVKDLVWEVTQRSAGRLNERVLQRFKMTNGNGSALPPGFYFLTLDSPQLPHPGTLFSDFRLILIASANLTIKTTNTEALIWLTDLTTGSPLAGVPVAVYDTYWKQVGRGVSNSQGIAYIQGLQKGAEWYDTFFAVVEEGENFGFAAGNWSSGVSPYDFGIWQDYYSKPGQPRAYLYTDRPLYRPGQPVYFKGILRLDDDLKYQNPQVSEVSVSIESYEEVVYEKKLPLTEFGSFSGELLLDDQAALGVYTIRARYPGQEIYLGEVSFNVAEYRKPEFAVEVTAEPANVLSGESFTVTVQADYYAGGPLVNAQASWELRASSFFFSPPDEYSAFSFSDAEWDICYTCFDGGIYEERFIASGKAQLDENGHLVLKLPAELGSAKTSQLFRFEILLTDFSGASVAGRTSVIVHRSGVYPGIRSKEYVGQVKKPVAFDLVALDWLGQPLPNRVVDVEIVERRWYSVQELDAEGRIKWSTSVEEIPAASFKGVVLDEQGRGRVEFIPENGGVFRARILARDAQGNIGQASTFLWVAGEDFVPWRQTNDRSMAVVADRAQYTPGETAEILIASPFEGVRYALVTVERGHVYRYEVIQMMTNSTIYRLPITAEMAPATYVSVLVVKGAELNNPPDFRLGLVKINVERKEQMLQVDLNANVSEASPGSVVEYTVKTRNADGQPVQAEVSLGLSDLAALSLSEPNSQPILDFFYYERGLSVWTAVPIVYNIEGYNAELASGLLPTGEAMGAGGGKGVGEQGVVRVRGNFPDTALWQAHVLTDQNGEARLSVTLPDNLTIWRMDARAVTRANPGQVFRVGQAQLDLLSTKPLLVRPQTPRFLTVGDRVRLGTAVHNNTGQDLQVQVSLEAQGILLEDPALQTVEIPAGRQALVTWWASVPLDSRRADLVFRAVSGPYADASLPPAGTLDNQGLPVVRFITPETVGTSGQMLEGGTRVEAISLPPSWDVQSGELRVEIAPSLVAGMTEGLRYLENYPYDCVEQTVSRFLPNVVTTRALHSAGLSDPALEAGLEEQVSLALQRLYNQQNPDGGWGWWGRQKSEPLTSAYVLLGLSEAKAAGYAVSDQVIQRAVNYLRGQVRSLSSLPEPSQANRQAFILYVLARAGAPRFSDTVKLYNLRQNLALYARAFLAQTLYLMDADDPRIQTLLSDFYSAAVLTAAGAHWEEAETDYLNWNTDTRTTAVILAALSKLDWQNPIAANAARWLMNHRIQGNWGSTQETAWTLLALTDWMVASGELKADYAYAVALNGRTLGGGQANAETLRQSYQLRVDLSELLRNEINRLAIARQAGPGNLYYTAYLDIHLPVERVQPVNRGIQISRSYFRLENYASPVNQVAQGELLLARLTIVAPKTLHFVVVNDPLPAGLEAVDQSLATSQQDIQPQSIRWEDIVNKGWGWWYFDHVELRDERVVLSATQLPAGTYVFTYLARAATPGQFRVIPPTAQEFYFPEVYGRGEGSLFEVLP